MKVQTAVYAAFLSMGAFAAAERVITLEEYRDKMKAAWIGQMVGVSWGQPTEFKWVDKVIPEGDVPVWTSDFPLKYAYWNDDVCVETAFVKAMEDHGVRISPRMAGICFANTRYWADCANREGRMNLRVGIAPPDCSNPKFFYCPNSIDYQIESDFAGIVSPGCPQEVIRLGNVFGRLVGFGDGLWAGQFVGAMYAEAFFTSDVDAILDAGLAAIPSESDYAQMVRNVRKWHRENPSDWQSCWAKIRAEYSVKKLRGPGGIDVRLNGACIVLGLLYGDGDLDKSIVLSMRCGWDSDCNPSNVGGVLFTARGFKALDAKYVEKLDYERSFSGTPYNLKGLFAASEKLARQVVSCNGGRVEKGPDGADRFVIRVVKPKPDPYVPSWEAPPPVGSFYTDEEMSLQKYSVRLANPCDRTDSNQYVRVQSTLDAIMPGWKVKKCCNHDRAGLWIKTTVPHVAVFTDSADEPAVVSRTFTIPAGRPNLRFTCGAYSRHTCTFAVRVNGEEMLSRTVASGIDVSFHDVAVPLEKFAGSKAEIEIAVALPEGAKDSAGMLLRNAEVHADEAGFVKAARGAARLSDIAALPVYDPGARVGYVGSIDPSGYNADWNWGEVQDENGEWILFEDYGPGCIYNFTQHRGETEKSPVPTFRFYFDGAKTPQFEIKPKEFGTKAPFLSPLAGAFTPEIPFRIVRSFVPMEYRKSVRVTSTERLEGVIPKDGWGHAFFLHYDSADGLSTFDGKSDGQELAELYSKPISVPHDGERRTAALKLVPRASGT